MTEGENRLWEKLNNGPECVCGNTLDTRDDPSVYPFCTYCGARNPFYYPDGAVIPPNHLDDELRGELADCELGHPKKFEAIAELDEEDMETYREQPFCELCGQRLIGVIGLV